MLCVEKTISFEETCFCLEAPWNTHTHTLDVWNTPLFSDNITFPYVCSFSCVTPQAKPLRPYARYYRSVQTQVSESPELSPGLISSRTSATYSRQTITSTWICRWRQRRRRRPTTSPHLVSTLEYQVQESNFLFGGSPHFYYIIHMYVIHGYAHQRLCAIIWHLLWWRHEALQRNLS